MPIRDNWPTAFEWNFTERVLISNKRHPWPSAWALIITVKSQKIDLERSTYPPARKREKIALGNPHSTETNELETCCVLLITFLSWNAANHAIMRNFGNSAAFRGQQQTWCDAWIRPRNWRFIDWRRSWWCLRNWSFSRTANGLRLVIAIGIRLTDILDIRRVVLSCDESGEYRLALLHTYKLSEH